MESNGAGIIGSSRQASSIRVEFSFNEFSHGNRNASGIGERTRQAVRTLRVLVGSGRSCVLHGIATQPLVLLPLRGQVRLIEGENARTLNPNQLFVGEGGHLLQAVGTQDALWVAFVAPAAVWQQLFAGALDVSIPGPVLLPATYEANRAVRRSVVHLAREARRTAGSTAAVAAALRFGTRLLDLQAGFDPLIKRCPGRSLAQRRGVFLRLQRVISYLACSTDLDLGILGFARLANYSPSHFVRTFNTVYGETPHAKLMEGRLSRALQLLSTTELSITEVARAAGFEDRCVFARSFKRRFGETASAARERRRRA
jgi:AraC family transcriptional regulator